VPRGVGRKQLRSCVWKHGAYGSAGATRAHACATRLTDMSRDVSPWGSTDEPGSSLSGSATVDRQAAARPSAPVRRDSIPCAPRRMSCSIVSSRTCLRTRRNLRWSARRVLVDEEETKRLSAPLLHREPLQLALVRAHATSSSRYAAGVGSPISARISFATCRSAAVTLNVGRSRGGRNWRSPSVIVGRWSEAGHWHVPAPDTGDGGVLAHAPRCAPTVVGWVTNRRRTAGAVGAPFSPASDRKAEAISRLQLLARRRPKGWLRHDRLGTT